MSVLPILFISAAITFEQCLYLSGLQLTLLWHHDSMVRTGLCVFTVMHSQCHVLSKWGHLPTCKGRRKLSLYTCIVNLRRGGKLLG